MTREKKLTPLSIKKHNAFHHPSIEGVEIKPEPYLTLPFREEDLVSSVTTEVPGLTVPKRLYSITEGWRYSQSEQSIHGFQVHGGIDYHAPYGTTVSAPCDGLAIASYHSFPLKDQEGNKKLREGKELYFGLGYFVQIYNPEVKRFVVLAHLSDIDPKIPFSVPLFDNKKGAWNPTNHTLPIEALCNHPMVVKVKTGDRIGELGYSGLRWGYDDYLPLAKRPIILNPFKNVSYDEPHVHLEEYWRDQHTGAKGWQRDPYDIYLTADHYPTPTKQRVLGSEPLFYLDTHNLPLFAKYGEARKLFIEK